MTDHDGDNDPIKYKRLTAEIRTWLDAGMFQPGEAVPSITDLAADRGWSRQTCSRAMRILVKEGRLTFYPGSGYHVSGPAEENMDSSDDQSNGANEASDNAARNAGAVDRSQGLCA